MRRVASLLVVALLLVTSMPAMARAGCPGMRRCPAMRAACCPSTSPDSRIARDAPCCRVRPQAALPTVRVAIDDGPPLLVATVPQPTRFTARLLVPVRAILAAAATIDQQDLYLRKLALLC